MTKARRSRTFDLTISARAGRTHVAFLRRMIRRAHALLRSPLRELSVALVSDREMSALHDRFMKQATPTDVLTFPLDQDSRGSIISGEIVICVPEALRQAKSRSAKVQHELLLYALHGMLHLHGLDDRTEADYLRIHKLEDQILTELGVGPVFAPAKPRTSA